MTQILDNEIIINVHEFDDRLKQYKEAFSKFDEFTITQFRSFKKTCQTRMIKDMRIVHATMCDDDLRKRNPSESPDRIHVTYIKKKIGSKNPILLTEQAFGRSGIVYIDKVKCEKCETESVKCLCIDSSDGEYGEISICKSCLSDILKSF